jgi:hypothetical protein
LTRTDAGFAGIDGMNSTHRAPLLGVCAVFFLRSRAIAGHHTRSPERMRRNMRDGAQLRDGVSAGRMKYS